MDLRGLKGRVSQWTGKLVDQILDQQQSSGQGPPPPPRPQQGPSPPYDTHPQYGSGYPQYGVNSQYQYGANPQYGVMPQYNQAPQYPQYPQYGQVGFQNNGQPPAFIPPRPPSPPDALHVRFKVSHCFRFHGDSVVLYSICFNSGLGICRQLLHLNGGLFTLWWGRMCQFAVTVTIDTMTLSVRAK